MTPFNLYTDMMMVRMRDLIYSRLGYKDFVRISPSSLGILGR